MCLIARGLSDVESVRIVNRFRHGNLALSGHVSEGQAPPPNRLRARRP